MKPTAAPGAGFSLVLSLIILSLLSILVVGFISSTAVDRATAHAFANKAQAQFAAETAVNSAISLLRENIAQYPDSATVWETLTPQGGGSPVEGAMLYYADLPPITAKSIPGEPAPKRYMLPLLSLGLDANGEPVGAVELTKKAEALGNDAWTVDNSVDLNRPRFTGDTQGWIGAAPDGRRPLRAKWMEVKEEPVPGRAPRTIGRYAFWVEDESFKVNLNLLGMNARESENAERNRLDPGKFEPGLAQQTAGLIPFQGLLRSTRAAASVDPDTVASGAFGRRNDFAGKRLLDARSFNQIAGAYQLGDETKFLSTIFSGGLNLSRQGSQRLNLNEPGYYQQSTDAKQAKQVGQIVEALRYHIPNLGQRFYRLKDPQTLNATDRAKNRNAMDVLATHEPIYLYKLAANLRDYLDSDSQPTLIEKGGKVATRERPLFALSAHEGPNDYWAQGKESVPMIQEVVARFRSETTGGNSYRLRVDYYVELWNMTNREIAADDLGPNPFIKISNPVGWFAHRSSSGNGEPLPGNPQPGEGRDLVLPLDGQGIIFKPGACTVITSSPPPDAVDTLEFAMVPPFNGNGGGTSGTSGVVNTASLIRVPLKRIVGAREFIGQIPNPVPPKTQLYDGFWPRFRETGNQEDYETEVLFGNDLGVLDSHPFTISKGGGGNVTYINPSGGKKIARDDTYGGTLRGNSGTALANVTLSQLGDPRTNNEQLTFLRYKTGGDPDQTRYFNPTPSDTSRFSLGYPNSRFVAPHVNSKTSEPYGNPWPDFYKVWNWTKKDASPVVLVPNRDTAPAVIANAKLRSIGELGDVFDPARVKNQTGSLGIEGARGGGRTFKLGQPDDLIDMESADAPSRQWAAWRLADFLGTSSEVQLPGLININGLRRDNGAALRAACYGMTLHPIVPPLSASDLFPEKPLDSGEYKLPTARAGVQQVIAQAIARLEANDPSQAGYDAKKPYFGPFMERGEISELPIFNTGATLLADVNQAQAFDHGREEFSRRLVEMTTTRGSVFSVYAIGEGMVEGPPPQRQRRVVGRHEMKVTFQLVPRKADGSDFRKLSEDFEPTPDGAKERFREVHHYDIQILQVSAP